MAHRRNAVADLRADAQLFFPLYFTASSANFNKALPLQALLARRTRARDAPETTGVPAKLTPRRPSTPECSELLGRL